MKKGFIKANRNKIRGKGKMCNLLKTTKKIFIITCVFVMSSFLSQLLLQIVYTKDFFEYLPKNEVNFNSILLKTFKKNKDENLIIAIDSNRFIGLSNNEDAYFIKDFKKNYKKLIYKITEKNFLSIAENFDGRYFYWIEGERRKGYLYQSCNWKLYAYDINTNTIYLIDKCNETSISANDDMKAKASVMWKDIFAYNGKVVYLNYEKDKKGIIYLVVKLFDMKTKKYSIIEKIPEKENRLIYPPSIYGDNIVWCISNITETHTMRTESGEIYLYNIKKKLKTKISPNNELVMPRIYKNYIIALRHINGISSQDQIVLCDISKTPIRWKIIVYPELYSVKNSNMIMFADPYISGGYLSWYGNYLKDSIYIFSLNDLKYYKIPYLKPQKGYSNYIMLYSENPSTNLFIRSYFKDNTNEKYSEYLILK
ncbi:hypothetical protein [Anaerocellum danielii]|uniref:Uncharacterized protein n=1 Tax=Anaerocellum danielii TaxID=1387557 RepID=A0ABZ0U453_9FIRM|nr:hypothetical protein [Caldicellulosiruptor danielii]WPX10051.1 hypothetical protein SOJ16_001310 [Caldicellulosiruptor danielii]